MQIRGFDMDFIEKFKEDWGKDPILEERESYIVLKFYEKKRLDYSINKEEGIETNQKELIEREYNPKIIIFSREQEKDLSKFMNLGVLKIDNQFKNYLRYKKIESSIVSITEKFNQVDFRAQIIDIKDYDNYLKHKDLALKIKQKLDIIIKDKFSILKKDEDIDTSAVLSNMGYIIKGFEGKYFRLSKGDKTFFKTFLESQIKDGGYQLKITESLPMFKEDIKDIIEIGKKLLKLQSNKIQIKKFSKTYFDSEKSTLEGCWQTYFDKYLKLFFMGYKFFYSQKVFYKDIFYKKDTRPDFLAVDFYNNIDIIEIKHHNTPLFSKEKNRDSYYPSADLNKSIFQLNKYLDLKSNLINLKNISDPYFKSLIQADKIYRPRGILIISSLNCLANDRVEEDVQARLEKEIKKIKTTYKNIDIILFDELITSLENYLEAVEFQIIK